MKSFQTYIYETKKTFEFRMKFANCDLDKPAQDRIKSVLEAYQLQSITAPKRMPIQEHRDFPKLGPCECHVIDVELGYPTIAEHLRQLMVERAAIKADSVCVYPKNQHEYTEEAETRGQGRTGALLTDPDLQADELDVNMAGQARADSLLKELQTTKHVVAAKDPSAAGKTTNELPQGTVSPVGSTQNKLQKPRIGNKK